MKFKIGDKLKLHQTNKVYVITDFYITSENGTCQAFIEMNSDVAEIERNLVEDVVDLMKRGQLYHPDSQLHELLEMERQRRKLQIISHAHGCNYIYSPYFRKYYFRKFKKLNIADAVRRDLEDEWNVCGNALFERAIAYDFVDLETVK